MTDKLKRFILFYSNENPDFIKMYGDLIRFYCAETESFHIQEIDEEYKNFS